MKRKVGFVSEGKRADIGDYEIYRILPNRYVEAVGPFIFLDHLPLQKHALDEPLKTVNGIGAHPHRGIATLTYIMNGEADHFDSRGHHEKVNSGGAQWMKAGKGIIHDEAVNVDAEAEDQLTHALQFWINLPAKEKAADPDYLAVQSYEMPNMVLADDTGWIKVLAGEYEGLLSKIPSYSKQFLFHIHVEAGKKFSIDTNPKWEYAVFLPLNVAKVNDAEYEQGDFLLFEGGEGVIEISNEVSAPVDIILFGGEPYTEPIVAQGPFVMNTHQEIMEAYTDFHNGKYGKINYS